MQIKVIKKGETSLPEKTESQVNFTTPEKNVARKVERNIMDWISDLREKKNMEFAQTQMLLSSLR
jgi:hypothetical protein